MGAVSKEEAKERIYNAAAEANFGSAPYLRSYEEGETMSSVLKRIKEDREEADKTNAELMRKRELENRIDEITAIAKSKGVIPGKYVAMLEDGLVPLDVLNELHADAKNGVNLSDNDQGRGNMSPTTQNANTGVLESSSDEQKYSLKQVDFIFPSLQTARDFRTWLESNSVSFNTNGQKMHKVV